MEMTDWPGEDYEVVYADPPWSYHNGGVPNGGVDKHYPTMEHDEICSLSPPAANDAVLYLWTTVTHAQDAFDVMESWGFEYKTQAVWHKQSEGVGYWMRGQHELIYIGTRGDVSPPAQSARRSSVFESKRGRHSSKPESVRRHIELAHPSSKRIELFARDNVEGWDAWGNELPDTEQRRFVDLGDGVK